MKSEHIATVWLAGIATVLILCFAQITCGTPEKMCVVTVSPDRVVECLAAIDKEAK